MKPSDFRNISQHIIVQLATKYIEDDYKLAMQNARRNGEKNQPILSYSTNEKVAIYFANEDLIEYVTEKNRIAEEKKVQELQELQELQGKSFAQIARKRFSDSFSKLFK